MSAPFAPSPKLREYIVWARDDAGCEVNEGIYGKKSLIRITSPDGLTVHQVGLGDDEPLCHSLVAYLDRRLGLDSPFPKTPDGYK
jgi:hypothetical protein